MLKANSRWRNNANSPSLVELFFQRDPAFRISKFRDELFYNSAISAKCPGGTGELFDDNDM